MTMTIGFDFSKCDFGFVGFVAVDEKESTAKKPATDDKAKPKPPRRDERISVLLQTRTDERMKSGMGYGRAMIAAAESVTERLLRKHDADKIGDVLKKLEGFVADAYSHRPDTSKAEAKEEAARWMSRMLSQPRESSKPEEPRLQPPKLTPKEVRAVLKGESTERDARGALAHLKRKCARYSEAERQALMDEIKVSLITKYATGGMSLPEAQRQAANFVGEGRSERPRPRKSDSPKAKERATVIPKDSVTPPPKVEAPAVAETPKVEVAQPANAAENGKRSADEIAAHHAKIAAELAAKEQRRLAQEALDAASKDKRAAEAVTMEAQRKKRAAEKVAAEAAAKAKREKAEAKRAKANKKAGRAHASA